MLLVLTTCASILSPSPGCRIHRVPLVVDVIPTGCAAKVQEAVAQRVMHLHPGEAVARYRCERRRRVEAEAGEGAR